MMREAHGVGVRELAAMVAISPSHLSRVEAGDRNMSLDTIERICDVIAQLPAPEQQAAPERAS